MEANKYSIISLSLSLFLFPSFSLSFLPFFLPSFLSSSQSLLFLFLREYTAHVIFLVLFFWFCRSVIRLFFYRLLSCVDFFFRIAVECIFCLTFCLVYLDQKVPGIHSENSKYKFYSSKVILSPSKYSPSIAIYVSA